MIDDWIDDGRMAPIDARHLFFIIWAATQTYADFSAQIDAVLGTRRAKANDLAFAEEQVVSVILRGCGFYYTANVQGKAPLGLPGKPRIA
jgi:TetR/AcrR family transcriptional regulator